MNGIVTTGGLFTGEAGDLLRLERNLKAYAKVRVKKTEDEILTQKGNDLRIKLFQGFWKYRFMKRNKNGNLWKGILKKIVSGGSGIKVRKDYLAEPFEARVPQVDKNGKKLTMRQKLVAQEMMRRVSGSGVLGISFLGNRWRFNKAKGWFTVENRTNTLGQAAKFEKREGAYIITGFTPGLAKIAERYGVLKSAINAVSRDIEKYLKRKVGPGFLETLHAK